MHRRLRHFTAGRRLAFERTRHAGRLTVFSFQVALDAISGASVLPPDRYRSDEVKAYRFKDKASGARVTQLALRVSFDVVVK
jgi:hypothetical protein